MAAALSQRKKKVREYIEPPQIHPNADATWWKKGEAMGELPK